MSCPTARAIQATRRPSAYISGALNGVPDLPAARAHYEWLGDVVAEVGLDAYIPHVHADPETSQHLRDEEVYEQDAAAHRAAHVIVAELGERSLGVGGEVADACLRGQTVIAIHPAATRVSRYTKGQVLLNPRGRVIVYTDAAGLRVQLLAALRELLGEPIARASA